METVIHASMRQLSICWYHTEDMEIKGITNVTAMTQNTKRSKGEAVSSDRKDIQQKLPKLKMAWAREQHTQ